MICINVYDLTALLSALSVLSENVMEGVCHKETAAVAGLGNNQNSILNIQDMSAFLSALPDLRTLWRAAASRNQQQWKGGRQCGCPGGLWSLLRWRYSRPALGWSGVHHQMFLHNRICKSP